MDEAKLFEQCRRALGMSQRQIARAMLLQSSRNVRRWEDGSQAVSGPAWVVMRFMLRDQEHFALAQQVADLIQERITRTWRSSEENPNEDPC